MAQSKSAVSKIIAAVVVLVLIAVVAFLLLGQKKSENSAVNSSKGAFESIKDVLSQSVSLKCEFTDDDIKTTSYIKNGAVRSDTSSPDAEKSGSMIIKDKKMFFWNGEGGFTMELPDGQAPADSGEAPKSNQGEEMLQSIEKYKDSCKPSVVSDSLFTPPTDVTFTDFSKILTPSGAVQNGSASSEEELKKLMEQYKQPSE